MMNTPLTRKQFRDQLLGIMDQKHHWAWSHFAGKWVNRVQLKIHFQQEYGVYVRDFPVFLARIHGQNPPQSVRKMLAENIYEEDTGGLSLGVSHPELFMTMMKGVGFRAKEFSHIALLPASRVYRDWLELVTTKKNWIVGAAVLTIFVEGSKHDRQEIRGMPKSLTPKQLEATVQRHPLVRYHGVSSKSMDLTRAHQMVENGHRHDAYQMVVAHAVTRAQQNSVLLAMKKSLRLWRQYRESVARACGLSPSC